MDIFRQFEDKDLCEQRAVNILTVLKSNDQAPCLGLSILKQEFKHAEQVNTRLSKWVQSCLGLCSLKQEFEHAEQADMCLSKWVQELSG